MEVKLVSLGDLHVPPRDSFANLMMVESLRRHCASVNLNYSM